MSGSGVSLGLRDRGLSWGRSEMDTAVISSAWKEHVSEEMLSVWYAT